MLVELYRAWSKNFSFKPFITNLLQKSSTNIEIEIVSKEHSIKFEAALVKHFDVFEVRVNILNRPQELGISNLSLFFFFHLKENSMLGDDLLLNFFHFFNLADNHLWNSFLQGCFD